MVSSLGNIVGDKSASALGTLLASNSSLTDLDLSCMIQSSATLSPFPLCCMSCVCLFIACGINGEGGKTIVQALATNTTLRTINLNNNSCGSCLHFLFNFIDIFFCLTVYVFKNTGPDGTFGEALGQTLRRNRTLTELHLSSIYLYI